MVYCFLTVRCDSLTYVQLNILSLHWDRSLPPLFVSSSEQWRDSADVRLYDRNTAEGGKGGVGGGAMYNSTRIRLFFTV